MRKGKNCSNRYEAGPEEVWQGPDGWAPEYLTDHPPPGKWSASEIGYHLASSEITGAVRLRRLLAEELPVIQGSDP